MPRDLFLSCAVAAVLVPFLALTLERAWTKHNALILEIQSQMEAQH